MNDKDGGTGLQFETLISIGLLLALRAVVLVVPLQSLRLDIVLEGHLYRGVKHTRAELVLDRER